MTDASISCAPDTDSYVPGFRYESISCPECGEPRVIGGYGTVTFNAARERVCRRCAARNALRARLAAVAAPTTDWVVIDRLMAGRPTRSNTAERQEAVVRLTARGLSSLQIADLLQITTRSVGRLRALTRAATPLLYQDDEVA